ncbi:thioredoxin family protein [Nafulsella turpanensis]|uniref:thioredoxin family protein n=1 Tax=Nafulsella turpanensis TaxID=1265690 RepID=UPI0003466114|nr:thioredoxin family protein [Nafulsella turpanensis]
MKKILVVLLILVFAVSGSLQAQTKRVENFTLPDAVSGKEVSLSDFQNRKAVVVLFTSNFCPYSKLYEERFSALVKAYAGQDVAFLMINPNDPNESREDSMESMKAKAASWGLNIPYLADSDQKVAALFGATKTPEVFVLSNKPNLFTVAYSGALDDNPQVAADVNQEYLKQALDSVLKGRIVNAPHKRPVGCMIKM